MNNNPPANWVVLHNPGQYIRSLQNFFRTRKDAEEWLDSWRERNPRGRASLHQYNENDRTILVQDQWESSGRWEPLE
jgi:hypothetical protein